MSDNRKEPTNPYSPHRNSNGQTYKKNIPQKSAPVQNQYPRRQKPKRKKKNAAVTFLKAIVIFLAIIFIGLIAVYFYVDSFFDVGTSGNLTDDIVQTHKDYQGDHVNILVCGIDYAVDDDGRDYSDGKGMTDLILLVSFDVKNKKVDMLQIPRDTYIGDATSTGKINAIYANGPDQENLISNLAKVINDQYNIPIDYFATITMDGFNELYYRMNVSLGGIEMYVPFDVSDKIGNTIEQGTHVMDAETMQWLLRQRNYPQADIGRLAVHQEFYKAMFGAFTQLSAKDLPVFIEPFVYYVNTDIDALTATSLGLSMLQVGSENISIHTAPGGPITVDGQSCYGLNPQNMAELLNNHFRPYGVPVDTLPLMPTSFEYYNGETYDKCELHQNHVAGTN